MNSKSGKDVRGPTVTSDGRINPYEFHPFYNLCRISANVLHKKIGAISLCFKPVMDVDKELVTGCFAEFAWRGRIFAVVHSIYPEVVIQCPHRKRGCGNVKSSDLPEKLQGFLHEEISLELENLWRYLNEPVPSTDNPNPNAAFFKLWSRLQTLK